jgi:hypothetical protein
MKIFVLYKTGKRLEIKREFVYGRGGSHYSSVLLLMFGNTLGLTPSGVPPSREHTCTGTSPTTKHTQAP